MTNYIFDATNPLPVAGTDALVELGSGSAIVDLNIETLSDTLRAFQASDTLHMIVGLGRQIHAIYRALELKGIDSSLYNSGAIKSDTDVGVLLSGGGTGSVTNAVGHTITGAQGVSVSATIAQAKLILSNSGVITGTLGLAVQGGKGDDRIHNMGSIVTAAADRVAINLGDGNDLYDGSLGTITGTIRLGAGQDTAIGGGGDETFEDGSGDDWIDGKGGIDTVDYSDATIASGIAVNLSMTTSQPTTRGADTLLNIENVIGSIGNDSITGSSGANTLDGGAGDDTLDGSAGNDILEGGTGNNTVSYAAAFVGAKVSLAVAGAQDTVAYGMDTLLNIQNLLGSNFGADTLTGSTVANRLAGNGGNDSLDGGDGIDALEGGTGNDTLIGGKGDNSLDGGAGADTAIFSGSSKQYRITDAGSGLFMVSDIDGSLDGTDTLKDVRFVTFRGDNKTVALTNATPLSIGTTSASVLESAAPGATVTTLFGFDPDGDTLHYTLLSDGGGPFSLSDTGKLILTGAINYEAVSTYTLSVQASDGYTNGDLVKTLTVKVNNVFETTPIIRQGTAAAEALSGELGADRLWGFGGGDNLSGSDGNDTLDGGVGNDSLYGGAGLDSLIGGAGNDLVYGMDGNDKLYGGAGRDTLFGGLGQDAFALDTKPTSRTIDWIYDFSTKEHDKIYLSKKIFTHLAHKGTLDRGAFVVGDHETDANDRIIYLKAAGALFYDPDGTGAAQAVQIATISKNLALKYSDFIVY